MPQSDKHAELKESLIIELELAYPQWQFDVRSDTISYWNANAPHEYLELPALWFNRHFFDLLNEIKELLAIRGLIASNDTPLPFDELKD